MYKHERDIPRSILNLNVFEEFRFQDLIVVALHLGLHKAMSFAMAPHCGTS